MALGRTELANEALSILLVVGAGQTADSEDLEKVDAKIDPLLEELSARDIVTVADDADIEAAQFEALAELLANACAPSFGLPRNPQIRDDAEERLRVVTRRGAVAGTKLTVDPALNTRRQLGMSIASWTRGW